jgi:hypothetical protein
MPCRTCEEVVTRQEKLSVFNAALTGLLASGHFSSPQTEENYAEALWHVCDGDAVMSAVDQALFVTVNAFNRLEATEFMLAA